MTFVKGMQKHPNSGRKPGVKNKKKIVKASELLADKNINPVEELLKLIPEMSVRDKVETWKFLLSYIEAKPSKTELEDSESENIEIQELQEVNPEQLISIAKSK